jgi:hypothetical protein
MCEALCSTPSTVKKKKKKQEIKGRKGEGRKEGRRKGEKGSEKKMDWSSWKGGEGRWNRETSGNVSEQSPLHHENAKPQVPFG